MKIRSVRANNRKHAFEVATPRGSYSLPYSKVDPAPAKEDPLLDVYVDDELGQEGFTWVLKSGAEGSVHLDAVLEYNEDPKYMRGLLLYELTLEAQECVKASRLSTREIIRRLGTSPSQFYRLLDPANYSKSIDRLLELFSVLDCEIDFTIRRADEPLGKSRGARRRKRGGCTPDAAST